MNNLDLVIRELHYFNEGPVSRMYGRGPLGAQQVFRYNKCVTASKICTEPKDIETNIRRLEKLFDLCETDEEYEMLCELKDLYNMYIRVEKNKELLTNDLKEIHFLYSQLRNFDSFKNNQNKFDNVISILKILERYYYAFYKELDYKPSFNLYNYDTEKMENEFKNYINSRFSNMRFFKNINMINEELI